MKKLSVIVWPGKTLVVPVNKMNDDNESRTLYELMFLQDHHGFEHSF